MSDSVGKRIREFTYYHNFGDGECNNVVLEYLSEEMNLQEKFELSFYFSVTYCVGSALAMYQERAAIRQAPKTWAREHRGELIFQSDRRWVKMGKRFEEVLGFFYEKGNRCEDFLAATADGNVISQEKAVPYLQKWLCSDASERSFFWKRFRASRE